jgi:hypothetical protein
MNPVSGLNQTGGNTGQTNHLLGLTDNPNQIILFVNILGDVVQNIHFPFHRNMLKKMPRQPRLDSPGIIHHIMIEGVEGIPIFRQDSDLQT